jgi:oligopeptide/dipeptide ABC transporter ATP-binding protein
VTEVLLSIKDIRVHFYTFRGVARAVDGVSFEVFRGESLGLVGESGSGKSVTGMSILRLIQPPGKIISGEIIYKGESILDLPEQDMLHIRGSKISMIFQNPRTCLNPVMTLGEQMDRVYRYHTGCNPQSTKEHREEMLRRVGIADPPSFSRSYPHQVSGGMCQRAMIVMAMICEPELVIADEPTTALDVTIQRQILELMSEIRERMHATQILITHDLGVVAESCDRIVVMYASRVMEVASTQALFASPLHPYTQGLLASMPRVDIDKEPIPLKGYVPNAMNIPEGCPFHPRCSLAQELCWQTRPELRPVGIDRLVACHFVNE